MKLFTLFGLTHLLISMVVVTNLFNLATAKAHCPAGFTLTCGDCYKSNNGNSTFADAMSKCESLGTTLFTATSLKDLQRLSQLSSGEYQWINAPSLACDTIKNAWFTKCLPFSTKVMHPEDTGPCCLTFYRKANSETKLWWMPCDNLYEYVCASDAHPPTNSSNSRVQLPFFLLSIFLSAKILMFIQY